MNGGVNGTMEEPMELSLPISPKSKEDTEENIVHESHEVKFISKVNSSLQDQCKEHPEDIDLQDSPINNAAFCSDQLHPREISNVETEESSQDNSNIASFENCCNSADSSRGSYDDNSQTKSVNNAMEKMEIAEQLQPKIAIQLQQAVVEPLQPSIEQPLQETIKGPLQSATKEPVNLDQNVS